MRARSELTAREREIVILIASGLSSRKIAQRLGIAFKTVETHRYNAMKKLKVDNVIGLLHAAIGMGLIKRFE